MITRAATKTASAAVIILIIFFFSGCGENAPPSFENGGIKSYKEIPGVTQSEIDAVEDLRKRRAASGGENPLIYAAQDTGEAFVNENGEISGYIALLCEWLSALFDIQFMPEIRDSESILEGLEKGEIHFTSIISAEDGADDYYTAGLIVQRPASGGVFLSPVSMAAKDPSLAPIISIANKALNNGGINMLIDFYKQGHHEYLKHEFIARLNGEEKTYLRDNPVIPFATQYFAYPTSFYNKREKKWDGIIFDILKEMEEITGLTFELFHDHNVELAETIRMLEQGTVYMLTNLVPNEERKKMFLQSENIYMSDRFALISKRNYPNVEINEIPYKRIGLVKDSAFTGIFWDWFPSAAETKEYSNIDNSFLGLDRGEVDMVMSSKTTLASMNNYYGFSEYKANYLFDEGFDFGFWYNKEQALLRSILDKAFPLIETEKIAEQWMTISYNYEELILREQRPWLYGAIGLSLCVIALIAALFKRSRVAGNKVIATLQNIFGGLDMMIHVTDPSVNKVLFINDLMKKHYNIQDDCVGQLCYEVLRGVKNSRCDFCPCNKLDKNPDEVIIWEEHDDRTNCFYRNTSRYINWIDGRNMYLHQAVDITDMKYELMKYELTRDALDIGLWNMEVVREDPVNPNNPFIWSNELRRMLGYSGENDLPNVLSSWIDRLHPEDREQTVKLFAEHLNDKTGKINLDGEYRFMVKSGEYRHFHAFGTTLRDNEGNPLRVAGALEDIEEKKQLRDALARREKMLNALNETAVILTSNTNEPFEDIMSAGLKTIAEAMCIERVTVFRRWGADTQLGQIFHWYCGKIFPPIKDVITLPEIPPVLRWLEKLTKNRCINANVNEMPEDEKEFLSFYGIKSIFFVPIFARDEFWGFITLEDHTNYRYFEEENMDLLRSAAHLCAATVVRSEMEQEINKVNVKLKDALEQATEASRAKGDFLSNMSHEMRTPLNAIIGMAAIGKKSGTIEKKDYALDKIQDASAHLLGVISDVLDMAKIEANKLELSFVEFDFNKMLQKIISVINFRMEEKKQNFSVNISDDFPRFLVGDDHRLSQVITNLLSNAQKFTPDGGNISLNAIFLGEKDGVCELQIEVADDGIGISREQQARLFQAFEQAESGTSREYGGTGLGLVITKNIVEMMGGSIRAESEINKGARFIFTVKAKRADSGENAEKVSGKKDAEIASGAFAGKRMLLAEDMEINREIIISLLEDTGLEIDCAENGARALEMVTAEPERYNIVFMDVHMPQMDGLEAARRIREFEAKQSLSGIPIVAMTANVFKSDIEECVNAGMNAHLGKPLDIEKVLNTLKKYL